MKYNKVSKLLGNASYYPSVFRTRNQIKINDDARKIYSTNSQIKVKTRRIKSSSCDETLPNMFKTVNKERNILKINAESPGVFQPTPMITFKRYKILQKIIVGHLVKEKFLRKTWSD